LVAEIHFAGHRALPLAGAPRHCERSDAIQFL
jgi:hypothetical protein